MALRSPAAYKDDLLALDYFEVGRWEGYAQYERAKAQGTLKKAPELPSLPQTLAFADPQQRLRADAAYALGFHQQIERERANDQLLIGLGVALISLTVVLLMVIVTMGAAAFFITGSSSGGIFSFLSMGTP